MGSVAPLLSELPNRPERLWTPIRRLGPRENADRTSYSGRRLQKVQVPFFLVTGWGRHWPRSPRRTLPCSTCAPPTRPVAAGPRVSGACLLTEPSCPSSALRDADTSLETLYRLRAAFAWAAFVIGAREEIVARGPATRNRSPTARDGRVPDDGGRRLHRRRPLRAHKYLRAGQRCECRPVLRHGDPPSRPCHATCARRGASSSKSSATRRSCPTTIGA